MILCPDKKPDQAPATPEHPAPRPGALPRTAATACRTALRGTSLRVPCGHTPVPTPEPSKSESPASNLRHFLAAAAPVDLADRRFRCAAGSLPGSALWPSPLAQRAQLAALQSAPESPQWS